MTYLSGIEIDVLLFIQEHIRCTFLDVLMPVITLIGEKGIIPIMICLFLLLIKKYRKQGIIATSSLALEFIIVNAVLKKIVARTRPYETFDSLNILVDAQSDYSFPSGHTGACFAVAFVLFLCFPKKVGVPAIIIAALVAFSRLYIGVHYPTDVAASVVIAFITAIISKKYIYPVIRKIINKEY